MEFELTPKYQKVIDFVNNAGITSFVEISNSFDFEDLLTMLTQLVDQDFLCSFRYGDSLRYFPTHTHRRKAIKILDSLSDIEGFGVDTGMLDNDIFERAVAVICGQLSETDA